MQYKVPQNVDIEDRVIGPLSLRQFIILLVAAGMIIVLYFVLVGYLRIIFWMLALIIGGIAFAFAFVKYGDQKLEIFAFSALNTLRNPRKRVWKKEVDSPQVVNKMENRPIEKNDTQERVRTKDLNDLERLANLVDSGGYSKVDNKDRIVPTEKLNETESNVLDVISSAEKPDEKLDQIIESSPKQRSGEQLVSDVASIKAGQKFDYPKIEVKDASFLDDLGVPKPKS